VFLSGPAGRQENACRSAALLPRKCLQAARPAAKKKPAGPVWRENLFLTTTATQLGSDGAGRPATKKKPAGPALI
jgi:hypothetical protein